MISNPDEKGKEYSQTKIEQAIVKLIAGEVMSPNTPSESDVNMSDRTRPNDALTQIDEIGCRYIYQSIRSRKSRAIAIGALRQFISIVELLKSLS